MARVEIPTVVLDPATGSAIAGASVELRNRTTGNLSTVYLAETGSTTVTNPRVTDAYGRVNGWVERGPYQLEVSGSGLTTYIEYLDAVPASQGTSVSATAPTQAATGDLWYDTNSGELLINYDSQWVAPLAPATVPTASASTITHLNQEGSSLSFARADHDHRVRATGMMRAYLSANSGTITAGTGLHPVIFNQITNSEDNVDGWYSTSTGRYTPQREGWYWIGAMMLLSNIASGYWHIHPRKNGNDQIELGLLNPASSGYPRLSTSVPIYCNGTTDYITISAYTSLSSGQVLAGSRFWAAYIGSG